MPVFQVWFQWRRGASLTDLLTFLRGLFIQRSSFRDARTSGAGPESRLTMVVVDSGLALRAPRNDNWDQLLRRYPVRKIHHIIAIQMARKASVMPTLTQTLTSAIS